MAVGRQVPDVVLWVTAQHDGVDHAVDGGALATARSGRLLSARCGQDVRLRPLVCPPGPRCRICASAVAREPAGTGHRRWRPAGRGGSR